MSHSLPSALCVGCPRKCNATRSAAEIGGLTKETQTLTVAVRIWAGMGRAGLGLCLSTALLLLSGCAVASSPAYSLRLIHRLSGEARRSGDDSSSSSSLEEARGTLAYYQKLLVWDLQRRKMKLVGGQALSLGNDFGWLHYTWVHIGTPSTPFLVALDDGSDLLWLPCNCIQCAPLSATHYTTLVGASLLPQQPSSSA